MDRNEITEILKERVLLLDGSYGAEFFRRSEEVLPERLNLTSPDIVEKLHREYVVAGADLVLTNTFGATPVKLGEGGIEDYEEVVREAVRAARRGADNRALVLGDIGPTGKLPYPLGEGSFDLFYENFSAVASIMIDEGVDGIILETFTDIQELKAAVLAVRDISGSIFLVAMMTFDGNGRSLTGTDPRNLALTFNDLDVDAVGVNCSLGPEEMVPVFQELSRYSDKLLVVEPNAGCPVVEDGTTGYPVGPDEMAGYVEIFCEVGANIIGGCCGNSVDHISSMRKALGERPPRERTVESMVAVTCPTSTVPVDVFTIIGERINPAGRRKLRDAMEKGDLEPVMEEARKQVDAGAAVLDVNFGLESSVPVEVMEKAVLSLAYNIGAPLSLDVQTVEILERLMKIYPGRPLINSTTCKHDDVAARGRLLERYGGMIIMLLMGDHIPKDLSDRKKYLREGLEALENSGISSDRVIFDPVVLSFGAGNDPFKTLEGIEYLSSNGKRSVIGLSNLSFGLPDRSHYNAAFLVMALERGLTSAIMNPTEIPRELIEASMVIGGRTDMPSARIEEEDELLKSLLDGDGSEAMEIVIRSADREGAMDVLEKRLKPAMERIGSMYSGGKIFLPRMIMAAQTVIPCFEHVEGLLPAGEGKEKVMIATVKGDIHDIGKNIVAAILRGSGYNVIDLGKDVDTRFIVDSVKKEKPLALGLSAMMTTTVGRIRETVDALREENIGIKVIAGGASLNERAARDLGADLYAKDAMDAVNFLKNLKPIR
jgi:5-methyltetrahydrofolate--homocysteine methyltransferase